jgi:hypothetical protein
MSHLSCPACGGGEWVPVVHLFLDVGLGRAPYPLALSRAPEAIWYRCVNGCVGITGHGELVGPGVRRLLARDAPTNGSGRAHPTPDASRVA